MSVLSRGVRNVFRNGIRTFSIVVVLGLSIALALTMLLARQAVQQRIDSVHGSIGNLITVSPAGVQGFAGGGEPLTNEQLDKVKKIPHVVGVTETLQDRLTTEDTNLESALDLGSLGRRFQNGQGGAGTGPLFGGDGQGPPRQGRAFAAPIIAIGTNDPTSLSSLGGNAVQLKSGAAFVSGSDENVALVGEGLATKNNLGIGGTFEARGTTLRVVGIFTSGTRFTDSAIVTPLSTLQRVSGQTDAVTNAIVRVDSITNVEATVEAIKAALGDAADVVSQQDTSQQALEPLENIKSISLFSLSGALVAGAVIIFLTMLMIVRERRREIGVLKAIGAPNRTVTLQFVYEAVTLTLMGALLGVIGGVVGGNPVTRLLVSNNTNTATAVPGVGTFRRGAGAAARLARQNGRLNLANIHAAVSWTILGWGLLAALVIAVLGTAVPSMLIARVRPAEVLRGE